MPRVVPVTVGEAVKKEVRGEVRGEGEVGGEGVVHSRTQARGMQEASIGQHEHPAGENREVPVVPVVRVVRVVRVVVLGVLVVLVVPVVVPVVVLVVRGVVPEVQVVLMRFLRAKDLCAIFFRTTSGDFLAIPFHRTIPPAPKARCMVEW